MPSSLGVVDVPALTKVTWDLHSQCQPMASRTPGGFKKLVTDLGSLQDILRAFADKMNANTSFFEDMDEDRKQAFQRSLSACFGSIATAERLPSSGFKGSRAISISFKRVKVGHLSERIYWSWH
jgi:hypothetical protein